MVTFESNVHHHPPSKNKSVNTVLITDVFYNAQLSTERNIFEPLFLVYINYFSTFFEMCIYGSLLIIIIIEGSNMVIASLITKIDKVIMKCI